MPAHDEPCDELLGPPPAPRPWERGPVHEVLDDLPREEVAQPPAAAAVHLASPPPAAVAPARPAAAPPPPPARRKPSASRATSYHTLKPGQLLPHTRRDERLIWKGHASNLKYLNVYLLCALGFWLIVPVFIALWHFIKNHLHYYVVTTQRIKTADGVFNRVVNQCELYRVRDIRTKSDWILEFFGYEHVILITTDKDTPEIRIAYVPMSLGLDDLIREAVEKRLDERKGQQIEVNQS